VELEVHLGAPEGPVIHTLQVKILRRLTVRAAFIAIQHAHGGSQVQGPEVVATVARVNRLLEPAGE